MARNPKSKLFGGAVFSLASLGFGLTLNADAQGQQQVLVIQGGTLIDGNGGAPVPNSAIVIQGNRISAVGRSICDGLRSCTTTHGRLSSRFRRAIRLPFDSGPFDQSRDRT